MVSSSSVGSTVVLLVCAPNLIRIVLQVLSEFSLLISHLGRHFILEGLFFAWVEGDSRSQQQQVFGPDIMNQAGRVYIPWNLNNLGNHLCCLTVTLFHGWCWDLLLLFNILILISASWRWNLKVSLCIIVSRFAKWLFKACRPSLLPCT